MYLNINRWPADGIVRPNYYGVAQCMDPILTCGQLAVYSPKFFAGFLCLA